MSKLPPNSIPASVPIMDAKAEPLLETAGMEAVYIEAIRELLTAEIPFLLAGTYAVAAYTGISRVTKDLDIFCKAGDYPRILDHFKQRGYAIEVEDDRWLAKVFKGACFFDVIFASSNGTMPIGDTWFQRGRQVTILGYPIWIVGPTELVWSKCFIQHRHRYDGADVAHLILKVHDQIDWQQLLAYMEVHWEVLLVHLLNFRWIYPSERHHVPEWLLDELLDRLSNQRKMPLPRVRVCRGRMFSQVDYEIDVREWGFADADGGE